MLTRYWDPLRLKDEVSRRNAYSRYVRPVCEALAASPSVESLATFLCKAKVRDFGVAGFLRIASTGPPANCWKSMFTVLERQRNPVTDRFCNKRVLSMRDVLRFAFFVLILAVTGCANHRRPDRTKASVGSCIGNLRQIDGAVQQWALDHHVSSNAVPTLDDVRVYFGPGKLPSCPQGGTYSIGRAGDRPTCSLGGPAHTLP